MSVVIADSSVLIALLDINQLQLLQLVFSEIIIPRAVAEEVPALPATAWIRIYSDPFPILDLPDRLGAGESEAISLAKHIAADQVILDELPARRVAVAIGLRVTGTVGVLIRAKQLGLIDRIKPLIEQLLQTEFRLSVQLVEDALKRVGE